MEAIAYEGPDGELLLNPTVQDLRTLFKLGPDYWQGGSGSAYVGWVRLRDPGYSSLTDRPVLHIIVHEPYGVCLMYEVVSYRPGTSGVALMTCSSASGGDRRVEHYLGGELDSFPGESFVPFNAAERAIGGFLQTQTPSMEVTWRPRRALAEGYGYAEVSPAP